MAANTRVPVARRLKEARERAQLSQKELGIRAGIDEFSASARMNQYETGKHIPSFQTLQKIGKVLKIDAAFFYCESDELAALVEQFSLLSKLDRRGARLTKTGSGS
jgi:transcriptional regulator with XRE-family HTH domain